MGDVEHHGREDITLELLSDQGASLYFLLEDSGPLQTSRAAQDLQAGGYYLKVEATQAWECGFTVARELLSVRCTASGGVGS